MSAAGITDGNGAKITPWLDRWGIYKGDALDIPCPHCGGHIVYNGNYFCNEPTRRHTFSTHSGSTITAPGCGWAWTEHPRYRDRRIPEKKWGGWLMLNLELITSLMRTSRPKDRHTAFYVALAAEEYLAWAREHNPVPEI